jgi:hypothetical protein
MNFITKKMTDLESRIFLMAYIFSNVVALLMLVAAFKFPRIARLLFFLLFAWASWANWKTSQATPLAYLDYSRSAFLDIYKQFINGWFSAHIKLAVGFIATCQGLIAISTLLRGTVYRIGITGGILFLIAILPLGFYAAFPCTLIMAIALHFIYKNSQDYIWIGHNNVVAV